MKKLEQGRQQILDHQEKLTNNKKKNEIGKENIKKSYSNKS